MTPERAKILGKMWNEGVIPDTKDLLEIENFLKAMDVWLETTSGYNLRHQLLADLGIVRSFIEARK